MKRFSIALLIMLTVPMAACAEEIGFNNLRGPITCLRSIAYRANCPASWDEHCHKGMDRFFESLSKLQE
jgi:hypothetical protein